MKYLVRTDDEEPCDAREYDAASSARAAEQFRAWYDPVSAEYPLVRTVVVRAPDGSEETFEVHCHPVPEYEARKRS